MSKLHALLSSTFLALSLTACGAADPTVQSETETIPSETQSISQVTVPTFNVQAMDDLLSSAVSDGDVIGVSALVYDEGQVVYKGYYGLGDRERGTAITADTVWRIYSMTKPVTSLLIMDLVEEGQLSLSDPASDYIPSLANMRVMSMGDDGLPKSEPQAQPMTVEDLMLHRSGMAYGIFGGNPIEEAYAAANLFRPDEGLAPKMERLSKLPLVAQPGEAWFYSYSIDVLGRIAEVVTGQPLDELMAERIFDPLGMTETGFYVRSDQVERFVSNYQKQPDGTYMLIEDGQNSPFLTDNEFNSGGGGLVSTLGDYAKFSEMILKGGAYDGGRIVEPETVRLMLQDHMGSDYKAMFPWIGGETGIGFGYGGSVQITATDVQQATLGRYPGQWGWGGAARTNMFIDPRNDAFGIIMLQFFSAEDPKIHSDFRVMTLSETRND